MASGGPMKELCDEASCSVCLDYFRDPVTIPECGHNFCRDCLTRSWGESGAEEASCCPQCRGRALEGNLRPNQQLANMVELIKKLSPQEGMEAKAKGREGEGRVCQQHGEPLGLFCLDGESPLCEVCGRSPEHKDHQAVPLAEAAQDKEAFGAAGKGRVCQKHQEPLKLFCKDDEALICVVCDRSKDHRDHETLPLEEASQEYKDQFCICLEILKKERERIVAFKGDVEKESQGLLEQTEGQKQETVTKFRQLHTFLEEQEKLLLAQMGEVEKEVEKKRDQLLTKLSQQLSSLDSLIREMEEKCDLPAGDLLQDARSTLRRYKEKESFENPAAFPLDLKWRIWDCSDLNLLLEGLKKQLKDTLDSGLHPQKGLMSGVLNDSNLQVFIIGAWFKLAFLSLQANVTLDPDTAHLRLILFEGWKSVRCRKKAQALPDSPERFDTYRAVLGREGFTGGRHFWEVLVGSQEQWAVGVARKSVRRKGDIIFTPEEGFWEVGKWGGSYKASVKGQYPPLTVTGELRRIRICLNYAGGRVAFFDADRAALLYEYFGASFSGETLLPSFWVYKKGLLRISC